LSKKIKTIALALVVMALWGTLYPAVKVGYRALGIDASSTADILMFAALRFFVCGLAVSLFCLFRRKSFGLPSGKAALHFMCVGVFSIVVHYACSYLGLSMTDSSKTALLKQTASLLYVCFAFLFFKDEKYSITKIIGALVGFCGIIAINLSSSRLTFGPGELLILCSSVGTVTANIISRRSVQNASPMWLTGISQLFGGIVLLIAASAMGARLPQLTGKGLLVFSFICIASIASYALWYSVLKTTPLSQLFIIKFAEPVFACIGGAILLNENIFKLQYLLAFILISTGIVIGHHTKKNAVHN